MSTITAILKPQPDGTLHLEVPSDLRGALVKVTAPLERVTEPAGNPQFGCLKGKIWMSEDFDDPLSDFADYMG